MVNFQWKIGFEPNDQRLTPHHFERHQWQRTKKISVIYLIYKWVVAVQFLVILVSSIIHHSRYNKTNITYWKWTTFLTNWCYSVCTIQAFLGLWILQSAWINKFYLHDGRTIIPKRYKIYWCMNNTAVTAAFTITVVYWSVVYKPDLHVLDIINLMIHIGNSVIMLFEVFLVAHPFRFWHVIFSLMIGSGYAVFSYIYYVCGGTDRDGKHYIYEALNWQKPGRALIFTGLSLVAVMMTHTLGWFLSRLRRWFAGSRADLIPAPESLLALQEKPMINDIA